ncbi:MAG: F0F1 ATP synthase subunit B [Pseudomonadota bacterium]
MASDNTSTEVGHSSGGDHGGAFPPFDASTYGSQLLWLAITFGILYYVMAKVALPRIGSILETRSNRIEQDLAEAQRLKEETDEAIADYEQALADARGKAHSIAQTARDKAKADADEAMTRVEGELATKLEEADSQISGIRDQAMAEVDTIAGETTEAIVKTLIGGRVAKGDITKALKGLGD